MQYLTSPIAQALSWALLHSLWQGVLIMFTLMLVLRCVPTRYARARYTLSLTALFAIVAAAAITFTVRLSIPAAESHATQNYSFQLAAYHPAETAAPVVDISWIDIVNHWVNTHVPLVLTLWCIGAIIFSMRVMAGWFYINTLRRKAGALDASWQQYIQTLAAQLQVNRLVQVAESGIVQAPVVLGYLKPIILLPIGMIGGLTTEQIETILIHELVHIRRHDYIVNLIQSCIEAIFFFNPCVWFISQQIRTEREHCCDDAVVSVKGSPKQYIHALAMLEEVRLSRAGLALALAENKNVLLNRIKRMMEKTAKKHSGRERIVPAVLLVIGLICASWITMKSPAAEDVALGIVPGVIDIKLDTTIKKSEKSGRYSRTTVTTIGDDGKPRQEVIEEYDGDESLHPHIDIDFEHAFEMPEVPEMPAMPDMAGFPDMVGFPDMMAAMAPMPPMADMPPMPDMSAIAFAYAPFFDSTMTEMDEQRMITFNSNMEDWNKAMAKWQESIDKSMDSWNAKHGEQVKIIEEKMRVWEEENAGRLEEIEKHAQKFEADSKEFEKELQKQLKADGYLKANESLNNLEWSNGNLRVNGQEIKPEHKDKYNTLHKKFFNTNGSLIYIR